MKNPTVLIFHHTDLDGMGVRFIATKYAQYQGYKYKTFACNYNDIDAIINKAIKPFVKCGQPFNAIIIIGDISVSKETAKILDSLVRNNNATVLLRDHHSSAEWLNSYPWAYVSETDSNGVPNCGTKLLYNTVREVIPVALDTLVETINDWDCWLWKDHNNEYAKHLNMLHRLWGDDKFIEYLNSFDHEWEYVDYPEMLFSYGARTSVEVFNNIIERTAYKCEKSMLVYDMRFPKYHNKRKSHILKCGIIFCNENISFVSDVILDKHPELDYIMCFGMPNFVSFRSQKDLAVPLPVIAKLTTGNGGGHPHAAGAVISPNQVDKIIHSVMSSINVKGEIDLSSRP